jgi:hypothetical protein
MILYQQHIMWYESKMINENLDSLQNALSNTNLEVKLKFCLNSQTFIETPEKGNPEDMFIEFINHPVLKNAEIIYKTNNDPFYNCTDWRRDIYENEYKYTVWGESDCLIPEDYFYILENLSITEPHLLTLSSRISWDDTWTIVEHTDLQQYPNLDSQHPSHKELFPYRYYDYINEHEMNLFNSKYDIDIIKLPLVKLDGSMLALSSNLPFPFISPDSHFRTDDICAQLFFSKKNIPQYHIATRIKGHNYHHPLKRINTNNTRNDDIFYHYFREDEKNMIKFLNNI